MQAAEHLNTETKAELVCTECLAVKERAWNVVGECTRYVCDLCVRQAAWYMPWCKPWTGRRVATPFMTVHSECHQLIGSYISSADCLLMITVSTV
eukprot:710143-Pelagomonas_calceolata.AAC.5